MIRRILLSFFVLTLSACQSGFQTMESSEHAIVFNALPRFVGGGIREKTLEPGEMEFIFPWQSLYRIDTSVQSISWGDVGRGDNKAVEDLVETRALDGNEVGLSIIVQYKINPKMLEHVVTKIGPSNDHVRRLVAAIARADIRTHMNMLRTRDFFSPNERQAAVVRVEEALKSRLEPEGIIISSVIYNDHRFERRLADGTFDRSYQEQIDKTQALNQETQQEKKKVAAVVERKKQEFNEEQARVNRVLEDVEGYKRQASLRGDAYFKAKENKAEQITAVGMAEVEGLKKQIAALSGPGGKALLRLTLVQALIANNPKFVLVNSAQGDHKS